MIFLSFFAFMLILFSLCQRSFDASFQCRICTIFIFSLIRVGRTFSILSISPNVIRIYLCFLCSLFRNLISVSFTWSFILLAWSFFTPHSLHPTCIVTWSFSLLPTYTYKKRRPRAVYLQSKAFALPSKSNF